MAYKGAIYQGNLENISLSGALVSIFDRVVVEAGSICLLTVYLKGEASPLRLDVEIIHCNLAKVGMRFAPLDECDQNRLVRLVKRLATEQDQLMTALERIKWQVANYLRVS